MSGTKYTLMAVFFAIANNKILLRTKIRNFN